jgi:hypothetical protein
MPAQQPLITGVGVHYPNAPELELIHEAHIQCIRNDATWSAIERQKETLAIPGSWDEYIDKARSLNINVLLILDYGNPLYDGGDKPESDEAIAAFAHYAEFVVKHFKGRVHLYEVWNEWDISIGRTTPGDAVSYMKLLRTVYPRLKAIDPSIVVIGGASSGDGIRSGWLNKAVDNGLLDFSDAVSFHPYVFATSRSTPEDWATLVEATETDLQKGGRRSLVPIYITEVGWPTTTSPGGVSQDLQAQYISATFRIARSMPFVKGVWWYDFRDDGTDSTNNEHRFGLVDHSLNPKPSYYSLQQLPRQNR